MSAAPQVRTALMENLKELHLPAMRECFEPAAQQAEKETLSYEQYLRRVRIERAKRMLASTRVEIERIGQACGFRDRHYFHRVFKRASGVTPGAYRSAGRE